MNRFAVFMALMLAATGATAGIASLSSSSAQIPILDPDPEPSNTTEPPSNSTSGGSGNSTAEPEPSHAHANQTQACDMACRTIISENERATGALSSHWEWAMASDMHTLTVYVEVGAYEPALAQDLQVTLRNGAGDVVASGARSGPTMSDWGTVLAYHVERGQGGWSAGDWKLTLDSSMLVGSYAIHVSVDCEDGYYYF